MDSGIRQRKDAEESSSSRHQWRHSKSRRGSDSRSSPVGYSHENFSMGIKNPSTSTFDDEALDQKLFDILEARYLLHSIVLLEVLVELDVIFFSSNIGHYSITIEDIS